jgi:hypothetical protein
LSQYCRIILAQRGERGSLYGLLRVLRPVAPCATGFMRGLK